MKDKRGFTRYYSKRHDDDETNTLWQSKRTKVSYKGKFTPYYPEKYVGDANNIIFRSLWELKLFKYLDMNSSVLQWSSEEVSIPYVSPVDGKVHRYFPDVVVKGRDRNGKEKIMMIEVKPEKQKKWPINEAKWAAARDYCSRVGIDFIILTEKDLKVKV